MLGRDQEALELTQTNLLRTFARVSDVEVDADISRAIDVIEVRNELSITRCADWLDASVLADDRLFAGLK